MVKTQDNGNTDAATTTPQMLAPTLSLPKGGGAIRGIGEKFAANSVTGTGSMRVPIVWSPSRSGFGPKLALSYNSGDGNGPFGLGLGWNFFFLAITRKTDKGLPRYNRDTTTPSIQMSLSSSTRRIWCRCWLSEAANGSGRSCHR